MRRKFFSQHPTFGSSKSPTKSKVEASPYYWWWLALTLNEDYVTFCARQAEHASKTRVLNTKEKRLEQVYEDFGDVRYEGERYIAFAKWWLSTTDNGETRGVYLFAEPVLTGVRRIEVIEEIERAMIALNTSNRILISIDTSLQRQHIDKAIDNILRKRLDLRRGRTTKTNPQNSLARYKLAKPLLASTLKKIFDLYEAKHREKTSGTSTTHAKLAKNLGLKFGVRKHKDSVSDYASRSRIISIQVSRYLSTAKKLISQTNEGTFGA
jgi:hypothetical protein